jgi:glycosyltransferase involved in cell wall biosynthesis
MKAAYHHPQIAAEQTSVLTPMRAALDRAEIDVVDVVYEDPGGSGRSDAGHRDSTAVGEMTERFANIDVWISEACDSGATDRLGLQVCTELDIPFVAVEPDARIAANNLRDAALQIAAQADHIVTTSSTMARFMEQLKRGSLTLLPPFIDVAPFRAAYKARELHKSRFASMLRLPEGAPWILTGMPMGADNSLRSYEWLAESLSRLIMMDWRLIIIASGGASAEAKERLLRLPHDRIRYCQPTSLSDLAAICVSCDLYVWPAISDFHTGALLEAQSSGLPVIAGRDDNTEDRVIDGQTGRLTPIGNVESFANAINFLLRHRQFLKAFSDCAVDTATKKHDLDTAATSLSSILSKIC